MVAVFEPYKHLIIPQRYPITGYFEVLSLKLVKGEDDWIRKAMNWDNHRGFSSTCVDDNVGELVFEA